MPSNNGDENQVTQIDNDRDTNRAVKHSNITVTYTPKIFLYVLSNQALCDTD